MIIKLVNEMKERNIPFFFFVRWFTFIHLKSENPELFKDIIPITRTFHQQMSYIHAVCRVLELYHHLPRVNYLTYCFKQLRKHPSPSSNGWTVKNGKCRAVRYTCGPLPECDNNCRDTSSSDSDSGTDTEYKSSADSSSDYNCCRDTRWEEE